MPRGCSDLLTNLLKDVSRSFYLTLRVLPPSVRSQIGLAYLFARATDTIADTAIIPVEKRVEMLRQFGARLGDPSARFGLGPLAEHQSSPGEKILLKRIEELWTAFEELSRADQQRVRTVLTIILSGQELDIQRFAQATKDRIVALETDEELEDYTYRVAGCVGEFWTRMCRAHIFPETLLDEAALLRNGVSFGKGLQLVNVLRDLSNDLRQGRCYLPSQKLEKAGLNPAALLLKENMAALRPVYDDYLDRAEGYLEAGWKYTNTIPYSCARVRLACAWPILIGRRTLQELRTTNVLDSQLRIKVSRSRVWNVIISSILLYPAPPLWRQLFR